MDENENGINLILWHLYAMILAHWLQELLPHSLEANLPDKTVKPNSTSATNSTETAPPTAGAVVG